MQQRTGKDDRPADGGLEGSGAVFGKAHLAPFEILVEVDRHGKAAMRRARGGVVAMGREMAAVLRIVAGDDVAFHPRHLELMDLGDLGHDAAEEAGLQRRDQPVIRHESRRGAP